LIRGVFGIVALIASLVIANIAAGAYSGEITGVMKPFVSGIVDTALSELVEDDVENAADNQNNDTREFSVSYAALRRIGLPEAAANRIAKSALESESNESFSDSIAEGLSSVLAYVAVLGVAFLLLAIVFAVIGNLIGIVFSLPGLKLVDIIAGSVFGLVKGLFIVLTIAAIARYFGLLALSTLEETSVLNYLVNNNIIADMLGI